MRQIILLLKVTMVLGIWANGSILSADNNCLPKGIYTDSISIVGAFPNIYDLIGNNVKAYVDNSEMHSEMTSLHSTNKISFDVNRSGYCLLVLFRDNGAINYVFDFGFVKPGFRIYHFVDEFLNNASKGVYIMNLFIDDVLYARNVIIGRDFTQSNYLGKDMEYLNYQEISISNTILDHNRRTLPNCTLIKSSNYPDSSAELGDFAFNISRSDSIATLLLLDNQGIVKRLFFNMDLDKGTYNVVFKRVDMNGNPLKKGRYKILLLTLQKKETFDIML